MKLETLKKFGDLKKPHLTLEQYY